MQVFEADDVYPLHSLDDSKANQCFVNWLMRFNDVLDTEKLNESLSKLLRIEDWRKLGGRLRWKEGGKLEIHVPHSPGLDHKSVFFTHQSHDCRLGDHPVASQLPRETDTPSVHHVTDATRPFVARPNFPSFEDMIRQNEPMISMHVTSFIDATLVAMAWPHLLMDAMGGQALLKGWSSVLAGREDEVPNVLGAREDICRHPLITGADDSLEELAAERKRLEGSGLFIFMLRFLWDKFWNSKRERRVIFIPKDAFARLKVKTLHEVLEATCDLEKAPFVSDSDILTAWITKSFAASEPSQRPVTVLNLMNGRFRLPLLAQSAGVFIQNIVLGTYTFLSGKVGSESVGSIALQHRQHFTEQATETQAMALLRQIFHDKDAGREPRLLFGESNSVPIIFNNLLKAKIMTMAEFGPAVVRQGEPDKARNNPLGTMVNYYNEGVGPGYVGYNIFVMLGQDHAGNYWLMGTLLPRAWAKIEQAVKEV
ncbi:hypothetical protein N7532_002316 [Penicillium argentinense]|uniref:Uncharacterized protein n=1 Tax=Penicillium argentinense TaxID=1131581 RepID=A0A9W9G0A5_9EURO|nr:uncharacterized protein N7532_002316 [Penicillium argentinense]KAJ5109671.1 hypothetical protein N7532_002316 [Penicillium argentinense]